ncbi:serine O-acetyltransferase [Vibrio clamense]|uniref:serine O-acetyltransferase n=1 Tax=Vibrio clamense TaxID=2910254 RepID=UPI003D20C8B0
MFSSLIALGYFFKRKSMNVFVSIIIKLLRIIYSFQFRFNREIGKNVLFCYYGLGVVIHEDVAIGSNVTIAQNVTIGGRSQTGGLPIIGNDVYIGAGAIILGNIKIGDNSVIGAGSVVISDIPENSVVAGVPAKVIKMDIENIRDYF